MHRSAAAVDDAFKMSLTLQSTQPDRLDQLLARAVSRLDGELGTIDVADPELAPARTRTVMRVRTRIANEELVVDPQAAADAIIERLRPAGPVSWIQARAA
jgi:anti-sigma28 factor (negative regulator of flagellin synthesis)